MSSARVSLLLLIASYLSLEAVGFVSLVSSSYKHLPSSAYYHHDHHHYNHHQHLNTHLAASVSSLSDSVSTTASFYSFLLSENSITEGWNNFQDNHTFLQGLLLTIAIKLVIGEIRRRIEKPIMDEAGRRIGNAAKEQLTPDTEKINAGDWAKLGGCVAMDLAGDASELIPVLGEFTDVAFAPVEAAFLQVLFKSPLISAFGFAEEILPFTDVVPTFTMSWILSTLFPTTPLAKGLLPAPPQAAKKEP